MPALFFSSFTTMRLCQWWPIVVSWLCVYFILMFIGLVYAVVTRIFKKRTTDFFFFQLISKEEEKTHERQKQPRISSSNSGIEREKQKQATSFEIHNLLLYICESGDTFVFVYGVAIFRYFM